MSLIRLEDMNINLHQIRTRLPNKRIKTQDMESCGPTERTPMRDYMVPAGTTNLAVPIGRTSMDISPPAVRADNIQFLSNPFEQSYSKNKRHYGIAIIRQRDATRSGTGPATVRSSCGPRKKQRH
jgi:hypothetical protein